MIMVKGFKYKEVNEGKDRNSRQEGFPIPQRGFHYPRPNVKPLPDPKSRIPHSHNKKRSNPASRFQGHLNKRKSIKSLFTTSIGRKLLLGSIMHALSPLPGMAPVVAAYDIYKAYKYAKMVHEFDNAIESWRQRNKKDSLKRKRDLQNEAVENIMERSQNLVMDMASKGKVHAEPYSDMMREALSESIKHGFNQFAGFVVS